MTPFDIFVYLVVGFSLVFSLMKGFVREIFSLLAYVGGYLMAVKYQGSFSQVLIQSIPSKPIAKLIAFIGIYLVSAILISLMGRIVKGMLWSGTNVSVLDRLFGGIVGIARGVVILIAVTFPLKLFPDLEKEITKDSYTAFHLSRALEFLSKNPNTLNIRKNLVDFDMEGAQNKLIELKNLKKLSNSITSLKKKLPDGSKPQDQYSKDDLEKLNDILKSVGKD